MRLRTRDVIPVRNITRTQDDVIRGLGPAAYTRRCKRITRVIVISSPRIVLFIFFSPETITLLFLRFTDDTVEITLGIESAENRVKI